MKKSKSKRATTTQTPNKGVQLNDNFDRVYDAFCDALRALNLVAKDNETEGDRETAVAALKDCADLFNQVKTALDRWVDAA